MKPNLDKAKAAHDVALMTGFCVVWMAAAIFAFGYFLDAQADYALSNFYLGRMLVSCGIMVAGIIAHAHLLMKRKREKGGDDLWM